MTSISLTAGIEKTEAASQGWNGADTALKRRRRRSWMDKG
jgi:hypothetical protein